MGRQINEPVVVGSSLETAPNTLSRDCCANCGHIGGKRPDRGDRWVNCIKHGRVTLPWWWCSDYLSEAEATLRVEVLAAVEGKPVMSLEEYLGVRREVSEIG